MASAWMPGCIEHMALEKQNPYYFSSRNQLFLVGSELNQIRCHGTQDKKRNWKKNVGNGFRALLSFREGSIIRRQVRALGVDWERDTSEPLFGPKHKHSCIKTTWTKQVKYVDLPNQGGNRDDKLALHLKGNFMEDKSIVLFQYSTELWKAKLGLLNIR